MITKIFSKAFGRYAYIKRISIFSFKSILQNY